MPAEIQVAAGACARTAAATSASRAKAASRVPAERRDPHHPAQTEPVGGRDPLDQRRHVAGSQPDRPTASGRVEADLHQAVEVPAALAARRGSSPATSLARSTESTTSAYAATAAALLLCSAPMKCQRRSEVGALGGLLDRLLVAVLPDVG